MPRFRFSVPLKGEWSGWVDADSPEQAHRMIREEERPLLPSDDYETWIDNRAIYIEEE